MATSPTFRDLTRSIVEKSLPAFGPTLQEVFKATESNTLSGHQIAEVILRDPALTSRVLRAANAAHLGHSGNAKVVTVSRAVVVLGVNAIRSLCISALTVESISAATRYSYRVQDTLGRALHAAVQARDMGLRQQIGKEQAERLFVEALLSNIGELAFWCFGGDFADRLELSLQSGAAPAKAEFAVLGTTLAQMGRDLLQAWNLGSVIRDGREVALARKLSLVSPQGWLISETRQTTHDIALLLRQTDAETLDRLQANAVEAASLAAALGARQAARLIPAEIEVTLDEDIGALTPLEEVSQFPMPNLQQQVRALAEMCHVATSRKELPILLETCLEGLYRAVGLDRCVFCLLSPDRTQLLARLAMGPATAELRQRFQWDWDADMESWLKPQAALWHSQATPAPDFLVRASGTLDCYIGTFSVDQKAVGFFYADRKPSGRPLSTEGFEGFVCFVTQAEMVMRALPR